jgi:hypothetical protein
MLGKILFLVLTVISTVACDAFVASSKTDSDVEDEKEYRLTKPLNSQQMSSASLLHHAICTFAL